MALLKIESQQSILRLNRYISLTNILFKRDLFVVRGIFTPIIIDITIVIFHENRVFLNTERIMKGKQLFQKQSKKGLNHRGNKIKVVSKINKNAP